MHHGLLRLSLFIATFCIYKLSPSFRIVENLAMVPLILTQLIGLPLFSLTAIHLYRRRRRSERVGLRASLDEECLLFGHGRCHFLVAVIVGGLAMCFGTVLLYNCARSS